MQNLYDMSKSWSDKEHFYRHDWLLNQSQKWQNDLCSLQRQTIQYHSNPSLCSNHKWWGSWSQTVLWGPTRPSRTNNQIYIYIYILFIIGDWNAKVRNQEIPGVTGKFGLGVQNEAGQRLTEFCQENALVIANIFFQQTRDDSTQRYHQISSVQLLSSVRLFAIPWIAARQASLSITNSRSSLKLTSIMVNTKIRLIIFFAAKAGEALYSQQKQDRELTVAQIMSSLLKYSDLNWKK